METVRVDGLLMKVAEQGALVAFMLLVIVGLCYVLRSMYSRIIQQADQQQKILIDSTIAITNNTSALGALTKQVERLADVR